MLLCRSSTTEVLSSPLNSIFIDRVVSLESVVGLDLTRCKDNMIGTCNGLFCFCDRRATHVYLWNPSTRSGSRKSPFTFTFARGRHPTCAGFCYEPLTDKYKVVFIFKLEKLSIFSSCVYVFGDSSWKEITNLSACKNITRMWSERRNRIRRIGDNGVLVGRTLIWLVNVERAKVDQLAILSFDLHKEEFMEGPGPKFENEKDAFMWPRPRAVNLNDNLCVVYNHRN